MTECQCLLGCELSTVQFVIGETTIQASYLNIEQCISGLIFSVALCPG